MTRVFCHLVADCRAANISLAGEILAAAMFFTGLLALAAIWIMTP